MTMSEPNIPVQSVNPPIVREYKGKLPDATRAFQEDAARTAEQGYFPVSQVYQPGSWGCGAFLVALLLCILIIGILVFIYMLIVKPAGVLVVTYEWREPKPAPSPIPSPQSPPTPSS